MSILCPKSYFHECLLSVFFFFLDNVFCVLPLSPDQNPKLICEYVRESLSGRTAPLHTVAYDCSVSSTNVSIRFVYDQPKTVGNLCEFASCIVQKTFNISRQMFLKELAEQTGGRYHCYVSTSDVSRRKGGKTHGFVSHPNINHTVFHFSMFVLHVVAGVFSVSKFMVSI